MAVKSEKTNPIAAILLLNSFSTGLIVPVLSLIFLSRGISYSELAIIMGIMAFSTVILELPTGILADVLGRKCIYITAATFSVAGSAVILAASTFAVLCLGGLLIGISRAFSSGSMEALYIDKVSALRGRESLAEVITRINIFETAGLSIGAAFGGVIPVIARSFEVFNTQYDLNLVLKLIIMAIAALLAAGTVKEPKGIPEAPGNPIDAPNASGLRKVGRHVIEGFRLLSGDCLMKLIFVSMFAAGCFLFVVEAYWQPVFVELLDNEKNVWMLGVLSFSCFASSLLGSLIAKKLLSGSRIGPKTLFPACRLVLAALLFILAFQNSAAGFLMVFAGLYLFLGMSNIPEGVLLNRSVPDRYRASALSLGSLVFQFGGLASSATAAFFLLWVPVWHLWIGASVLLVFAAVAFMIGRRLKVGKLGD